MHTPPRARLLPLLLLAGACGEGSLHTSTDAATSVDPVRLGSRPPGQVNKLCRNVTCSGHGTCLVVGLAPTCACDAGYEAVDLSCAPVEEPPPACVTGADCDDGDPATLDTCAAGTCEHAPIEEPPPTSPWEGLLTGAAGFGRFASGGAGGPLCAVTSLADSGAGTLRACLTQPGPVWIHFSISGTIPLASNLRVPSDVTIDGRGAEVRLTRYGLVIRDVSNVIVHNLRIEDGVPSNENGYTAIEVRNAKDVWIDHVSLARFADGLLDIGVGATDVTVSWSELYDHGKVMLIGFHEEADFTGPRYWVADDRGIRVTLHHNYFHHSYERHPRLRYGKVHAYNNLLHDWAYHGMASVLEGELFSEHNIFEAVRNKYAILDRFTTLPGVGYVRSVGDLLLGGAVVKENEPARVFAGGVEYPYALAAADAALRDRVATLAGVQPVPFPD